MKNPAGRRGTRRHDMTPGKGRLFFCNFSGLVPTLRCTARGHGAQMEVKSEEREKHLGAKQAKWW